jgi:NitT/TauT family transport system substrate-binding protein
MRKGYRTTAVIGLVALLSAVSACGSSGSSSSGSSGGVDTINITYSAITAAYGNLYAEQEAGIFAKHGLKVTFNALQGSSELDAALVSGHSQIGLGPAVNSASAILKGIPLKFIDISQSTYNLRLWAAPSIHSAADLQGKKVAVGAPSTESDFALTEYLKQNNMPADAVQRVYVGTTAAEYTAVETGAAVATFSAPPNDLTLQTKGYKLLTTMTNTPNATVAAVVSASWLNDNMAVAKKFYAAEVDGLAYLRSNPTQTKAAIMKYTGIKNQSQVDAAYTFFLGVWAKTPAFDSADVSAMQSAFAEAATKAKKPAPSAADIQKNYLVNLDSSP